MAVLALVGALLAGAGSARAQINPPATIDGPSSAIVEFGGVAMASDGTGGLVYVKSVGGVPHVFASRFLEGKWGAPERVDRDRQFEASQARIAAGPRGELLVVWVTPVATVKGKLQFGLFSSRLPGGAGSFGHSHVVDPNVGEGRGVAPSVAGTAPGKAIVAYRVVTFTFQTNVPAFSTAVQLRPGDVMAEFRLARLSGDRWSRLGAINRNPEASTRPPTATNGPQVGIGLDGGAVVAWQEPDQTGAARIFMRRVFGSTPGPVLQASPSTWEGAPVTADVDSFSLSVTPQAGALVAFRVAPGSSPLAGRILDDTLPPTFADGAAALAAPKLADGGAPAPGPASASLAEGAQRVLLGRVGFVAGARLRQMGSEGEGAPTALPAPATPPAQEGAEPVVVAAPEGDTAAWSALDPGGDPAVAVRQELASGEVQNGLLAGAQGGPVTQLAAGASGLGDALIGFRQGEAGEYEIVGDWVSVPPSPFTVKAPKGWVKPSAARVWWQLPPSGVGGLTYAVLVDGNTVTEGLRKREARLPPAQLGSGILQARVLATDGLGQQHLSEAVKLRVDGRPPSAKVRVRRGTVTVKLADAGSGLAPRRSRVSFGDGTTDRHGARFRHKFASPGLYTVTVRAEDRVGNRLARRFEVRVR
ncbi:MAG TPA: PKD domain-containing protein [Solirubrobacterales bacterium]|nr:PKD domain-containing protein [Solirubrobacterales bacterium]